MTPEQFITCNNLDDTSLVDIDKKPYVMYGAGAYIHPEAIEAIEVHTNDDYWTRTTVYLKSGNKLELPGDAQFTIFNQPRKG